jgi:hypothetical protein
MSNYIYNDEDNAPMNDEAFDRIDQDGHNPTVYGSYAEMMAIEKELPFTDPPEDGCWNCLHFDYGRGACTVNWNNMDESYYNPLTDDRDPDDRCPEPEKDEDAVREDRYGNNP